MTRTKERVEARYPIFLKTEIEHDGARHHGALHDVSVSGAFVESDLQLEIGTTITIQFKDTHERADTGMVFLHYTLTAKIATVITRAGLVGFGLRWVLQTDAERLLLKRLIADAKARRLPLLSIEAQTARGWAVVLGAVLGFFVVCVAINVPLWQLPLLREVPEWRWPAGIVGGGLIALGLVIAVRRRGLMGTRTRGSYGRWLAFHSIAAALGLVVLALHVCERRGRGIPFVCAILVAAVPATALPRLWTWKRMPHSKIAVAVSRHWLKLHVVLIGPLIVAVAWHVVQVIVF